MGKIKTFSAALALACAAGAPAEAGWQEFDLTSFEHGQVVNSDDFNFATLGVDNFHSNLDLLVAFDTRERRTSDSDLEGPNGSNGSWKKGNLKGRTHNLGNILIIQEGRGFSGYTDGTNSVVRRPDDEGKRSGGTQPGAGEINIDFQNPVSAFGFTLIDVEETGEFNNETGFFATFSDDLWEVKVSFADFIDPNSVFYDPTIQFGDNSANRISPITASQLGLSSIDRVSINLGGSGGVGEMRVTGIPTPGAAFAGVTMMGLLLLRRRQRPSEELPA